MNRCIIVIVLICSLLICASCVVPTDQLPTPSTEDTSAQSEQFSSRIEAQVVRVIDGDTIEVSISGNLYRVRYIGINTPEVGQWGADEATQVNALLVSGKVVELEKDVSETDKYGRLLRYVWVNGNMVNAVLVANGYAQVATYPPDVKYQEEFLRLQRQAQEAGLGLWALEQPTIKGEGVYVGSIRSNKYHYPSCRYAQQINPENEIWFSSASEAQAMGYVPCKVCNPPTAD